MQVSTGINADMNMWAGVSTYAGVSTHEGEYRYEAGMSMYAGKGIYEWGYTGMSLHALIDHDVQV